MAAVCARWRFRTSRTANSRPKTQISSTGTRNGAGGKNHLMFFLVMAISVVIVALVARVMWRAQ